MDDDCNLAPPEKDAEAAKASQSSDDDSNTDQWKGYLNLEDGEEAAEVDDDRNLDQPPEKDAEAAKVDVCWS